MGYKCAESTTDAPDNPQRDAVYPCGHSDGPLGEPRLVEHTLPAVVH